MNKYIVASEAIKSYLEKNGIKHAYVAKKLKRSEVMMSKILSGRANLNVDELLTLCELFDCTPNDLLGVE